MERTFKVIPILKGNTNDDGSVVFSSFYLQNEESGEAILIETTSSLKAFIKVDWFGNDIVAGQIKKQMKK